MTNPNSGNIPMSSPEQHWPTTVAALAVGTAFFSLWFWLLPQWLGFRVEMAGAGYLCWRAPPPPLVGFPRCPALRLGFWLDWTRDSGPVCAAATVGCCRLLPPRAQSHVRGVCSGLDRAVGCLRARQPALDCRRRSSCSRRASVRNPL